MIYNGGYKVKFYCSSYNQEPVKDYLLALSLKERQKINKFLDYLQQCDAYLNEPYSRHIIGKIRELRIDLARRRHRIFYFTFINKTIILLHAFLKRTKKTPWSEINKALSNYLEVLNHPELYE